MNDMVAEPLLSADDMTDAVRATAMLADVSISTWTAEQSDRGMMDKIKTDAGATGDVGRAIKNVLAGADGGLKEARSAYAAVRAAHYAMTLPWVSDPHATRQDGPRLLPNMLFTRYLSEMGAAKRAAEAALDKFVAGYPDDVAKARINLAGLADAVYPDEPEVRARFRVSFDFEPLPSGAAFHGLPEHFVAKLGLQLKRKQDRMIATATAAMWERVRERTEHLASRLSDPESRFRSTTVEHVHELIGMIPAWNVASDERAIEIASDIADMLAGVKVKDLRGDALLRKTVAEEAARIVDKLSGWGL